MATPLLECIPNISEGRDAEVIAAVAKAIEQVDGVYLLEVDPGVSANRTVFTFAGNPAAVVEGAFQCIATTASLIDMRNHTGIHPRMGATDVCPLVPLAGLSLDEADRYAQQLAARVGEELGIPVYLYEHSATAPHRKNLAHIRSGEYEGFREKIQDPRWIPDAGPMTFQPRVGQTVIGARPFLLAYNLNLDTTEVALAQEIARGIRESGRLVTQAGRKVRVPGLLKGVKAIGWYVEEYGFAQVSTNITRLAQTGLHEVFETTQKLATRYEVRVTGSELVGMIPQSALLSAADAYQIPPDLDPVSRMEKVAEKLGLNQLGNFRLADKVISLRLKALGAAI